MAIFKPVIYEYFSRSVDMSIKISQSRYEPIPSGIYQAKIEAIEPENGIYGPQLKFKFVFASLEGFQEGKFLHAWCSQKFTPKSKLYSWTASILGKIAPDYIFDSDDLLNRDVMVVIGQHMGSDGVTLYDIIEAIKPVSTTESPKSAEEINQQLGEAEAPE